MPVLNASVIRKLVVPIIAPKERERIAQQLDAIVDVIRSEKDSLHKLTLEKLGLMRDLLTGIVRAES